MSKDLIAIIGVGVSLAGLILYSQHNLRSEMKSEFNIHLEAVNGLREDVGQLQERVARQEGLMEGLRDAIIGSRELVAGPG